MNKKIAPASVRHNRPLFPAAMVFVIAAALILAAATFLLAAPQADSANETSTDGTHNTVGKITLDSIYNTTTYNYGGAGNSAGFTSGEALSEIASGITPEESIEECPLFLQGDERWGSLSYGESIIALSGCGPTCLSMVLYSLTRDTDLTPDALADLAMRGGYYVVGAGTAWSFMEEIAPQYGVFVHQNAVWNQQMMEVYLDDGKLLICAMGPGNFTDQGHFLVIRGHSDGKFLINDPFSRENSEKEWDYDTISSQCRHIWAFERIGGEL